MKSKYLNRIILLIAFFVTVSCNKNDDDNIGEDSNCVEHGVGYVTSVNAPSSVMVDEAIDIKVSFGVSNGCGGFDKYIETVDGNNATIEVVAKYVGCICTQDAPIRIVNYEFSADTPGDYELKFKSSPSDFITVNLTVN